MRWPWGKTYTVKCPDGSEKTVHRNVDAAFPLFIKGWKGQLKGEGGVSADSLGIEGLKGKVEGKYASHIDGLLYSINELNQSCMINFRTVYLTFASDPCGNAQFLRRQVEKIIAQQDRLTHLGIRVRALIELVRNRPNDTPQILEMFKEIAGNVGGPPALEAIAMEIEESRQIADDWSGEHGR